MITSELQQIPGIGAKTIDLLLQKYKSVEKLRLVSKEHLINDIGVSKANIIIDYFTR